MPIQRTQSPEGIQLSVPASYYRVRGAIMSGLGLAISSLCCCTGAVGAMDNGELGPVLFCVLLGLVLGVLLPMIGASIVFRAASLARTVTVTPTQLVLPEGVIARSEIVSLELSHRESRGLFLKQWPEALAIDRADRAYRLSGPIHITFDGHRAAAIVRGLAEELGVPFFDRRVNPLETPPWLCYLPIAGVFLVASIGALIFSRDPRMRFAAKQSLLHLALTMSVAVVFGVLIAISAGLVQVLDLHPGLLAIPGVLWLGIHVLLNLVLRFYASYRASKNPMWVAPWLRAISGRWAESEPPPTRF